MIEPFDIRAPLPTGTTVLEASAGTGKTWTIGALVTRYVAEDVATLDQMLIVTFGRAASQELRERVRTQLVEAERALAGADDLPPSELLELLLDCDDETRRLRHRRVVAALASFDGATIATTHQFCSLVLGSLGVAGDTDARARLVEDLDDLLGEVVSDLYLRRFAYDEAGPAFSHAEAMAIARTAVGDPQAWLEPADADATTPHGRRVAFAQKVRRELDRRKRRLGILSYDDLLSQLADALADPDAPARARMRQRWQIVLVDEFQDTDPVQWQVLDRAFSGHATMVLIGDPKQAIYSFRGGDVVTYLQAAGTAATQQTLDVNWRSDDALLASFQTMLRGAALGDDRIVVHDVTAHHDECRLVGAPHPDPFRLRVVRRDQLRRAGSSPLTVGQVRPLIADDLARDVRAAAGLRRDLRRPADRAARRRGHQLPPRRPRPQPGGTPRGGRARRDRGRRQRVRHACRGRVAAAAGGTRAAPPQPAGPLGRPHDLLRPHRSPARRRRRAAHRRGRRPAAVLDRGLRHPGSRSRAGGGHRGGSAVAGARRGRWRAPPHRPAPHRRGAPRGRPHRAARRRLHAGLAAPPGRRGPGRPRHRAHPPARLRRRRGPAGHHPRQQGTAVPRRLPARAGGPQRPQAVDAAVPRRRRPALRRRRRRRRRGVARPRRPVGAGGGGRVAAAALRRGDPGAVPGRGVVGPHPQHPGVAAPPAAAGTATGVAGRARRLRQPHRRRGGRRVRALAGGGRTGPRAGRPGPAGRRRPARGAHRARGADLRPRRRHRLAAYVVLLADPGRAGRGPGRGQ